jgi:hypothetical protein
MAAWKSISNLSKRLPIVKGALKVTSNMLGRASLSLEKASAAIRESEAKIAKSKFVLQGLRRDRSE